MSYEQPGFSVGHLPANQDLSAVDTYQFTPVKVIASTGTGITESAAVAPVSSSGDGALGLLQNDPKLGEAANVMISGVSKAKALETIAVGDKLSFAVGGVKVADSAEYQVAVALEPAVVGDVFAVLLLRNGKA